MANTKTLVWRGNVAAANAQPLFYEGICLDAMLPGTLVQPVATGISTTAVIATVFNSKPVFANRDVMRQKNMDTAWVLNDSMQAVEFRSGEFGCIRVAAGQNITARRVGLSSNGDGTLKIALTDGTEQILCYSDEIINTGGVVALVNVYF